MKLLVAEDDLTIRTWLKVKLTQWGYEFDLAKDGAEAFALYEEHRHDLILTDWMMPNLDGIGLIRKIVEISDKTERPYIIMVTAKQESGDLITGVEAGADDYVIKPVKSEELRARLIAADRIIDLENTLNQKNQDLETANLQMKNDLTVAAKIQQSFLPHHLPEFENAEFQWGLLPCDELAGDALNVISLDDDHVGFYLLDVSGHGVAAALLAMTLIHTLSGDKQASPLYDSQTDGTVRICPPHKVAAKLNNRFPMDDINGQYFTFIYGILNLETLQLQYTAAGHPGPVLVSPNHEPRSYDSTGMPVGFIPDTEYEMINLQLAKGDRLYVFSDGIMEATNKYGEQFGVSRFKRILNQHLAEENLRVSIDNVAVAAIKWHGMKTMTDDVSILGLQVL